MKKLYPFDEWFAQSPDSDGRVRFHLQRGEHYISSQSSMCQQLRLAAHQRGLRISLTDLGDSIAVTVAPRVCPPTSAHILTPPTPKEVLS